MGPAAAGQRRAVAKQRRAQRSDAVTRAQTIASPSFTLKEAGARAQTGLKVIYREVKTGRLRPARIGGRRELRFLRRPVGPSGAQRLVSA